MKKFKIKISTLLVAAATIGVLCSFNYSNDDEIWDDQEVYLEPGETILVNDEEITNYSNATETYIVCPGKGVSCNIKIGGTTVYFSKDKGKPDFEKKMWDF